jgi:hypothetical protein
MDGAERRRVSSLRLLGVRHLLAQIADFGQNTGGQNGPKLESRRFRRVAGQFWPNKITVVGKEHKLKDGVTRFQIAKIYNFLAAANAIVADESGVRRCDWHARSSGTFLIRS